MRIFVTAIACVLTTFSYLPSVFADDCDAVLITTSIRTHSRDKLALATLKLVDQENYDQVKAGIGALGTIPIEGVPVDFGVSFDKFSEQRNKVYQKETLHFTRDTAHSLVMSYLDESIAKTWLDCKRVKSPGFHLAPLYRSETEIIIKAVWQPPQGLGTERLDKGYPRISGGRLQRPMRQQWLPNSEDFIYLIRDPRKELVFSTRLRSGYPASITYPAYPRSVIEAAGACTKWDSEWRCLRCEFPYTEFKGLAHVTGRKAVDCTKMPARAVVRATFTGDAVFDDNTPLSGAWAIEYGLSVNGGTRQSGISQNTNRASYNIQASGNVPPNGHVVAEVHNGFCQHRSDARTSCSIKEGGSLIIEASAP